MNIGQFCSKAIKVGIENDPRGPTAVKNKLNQIQSVYEKLSRSEKKYFDKELFKNPYPDSRLVYGEEFLHKEIVEIACGIDITPSEILAVKLDDFSQPSMILSHHPIGKANAAMWQVIEMQIGIFKKFGAKVDAFSDSAAYYSVETLYEDEKKFTKESYTSENLEQETSIAELFKYPLVCMHTAADNCVTNYLQDLMDTKKPRKVGSIINLLLKIPEYQHSARNLVGPHVVSGKRDNKAGKILIDMTGGVEAPTGVIPALVRAGIGTIVSMHVSQEWYEEAERNQLNIVCAGHMSSDCLGMNLLLDEVFQYEEIDISGLSSFQRVYRYFR